MVAPFIRPADTTNTPLTGHIPYYVFPTVVLCTMALGAIYWVGFAKVVPLIFGYKVDIERYYDERDGVEVVRYRHIKPWSENRAQTTPKRRRPWKGFRSTSTSKAPEVSTVQGMYVGT
jgi:hypothetical protein